MSGATATAEHPWPRSTGNLREGTPESTPGADPTTTGAPKSTSLKAGKNVNLNQRAMSDDAPRDVERLRNDGEELSRL